MESIFESPDKLKKLVQKYWTDHGPKKTGKPKQQRRSFQDLSPVLQELVTSQISNIYKTLTLIVFKKFLLGEHGNYFLVFYEENLSDSEKGLQFELVWLPVLEYTVKYYDQLAAVDRRTNFDKDIDFNVPYLPANFPFVYSVFYQGSLSMDQLKRIF